MCMPSCAAAARKPKSRSLFHRRCLQVQFDRLGAFTGIKMGMSLKGHKSKVGLHEQPPQGLLLRQGGGAGRPPAQAASW